MKTGASILLVLLLIINASCISKAGLQNSENITPPQETEDELEQEPEGPLTTTSFGAYKHVFIIGVDGGGASFVEWNPINIGIVEIGKSGQTKMELHTLAPFRFF